MEGFLLVWITQKSSVWHIGKIHEVWFNSGRIILLMLAADNGADVFQLYLMSSGPSRKCGEDTECINNSALERVYVFGLHLTVILYMPQQQPTGHYHSVLPHGFVPSFPLKLLLLWPPCFCPFLC